MALRGTGLQTAKAPPFRQALETAHQVLESSVLTSPNTVDNGIRSQENLSIETLIHCIFKVRCYFFPKTTDFISSFYSVVNNLNHNNLISKIRIWTSIIFFHSSFWMLSYLKICKREKISTRKC